MVGSRPWPFCSVDRPMFRARSAYRNRQFFRPVIVGAAAIPFRLRYTSPSRRRRQEGVDLTTTPSVFANSAGDGEVVHRLLSALAKPNKPVSPTDFHNSVHNASAFYWSLGTSCQAASTSIAAARFSFAAALLKAAMHSLLENTPIIMVCFDKPLLAPLSDTYPLIAPLAVGFALWPRAVGNQLAELDLSWVSNVDAAAEAQRPLLPELAELWSGNPAGHAIPLLEAVANQRESVLYIPGARDAVLRVDVTCP